MTDPYGSSLSTGSARGPASSGSPRRPPRWAMVGLPLVLVGLLVVAVVAHVLGDVPRAPARQPGAVPSGSPVPSSQLQGEWSGEGALTRCAGFDEEGCPPALSLTLTIDCAGQPCAVTLVDPSYGSPPLRFDGGRYRAVGPVPPEAAPTCGGAPTSSAVWRLELAVVDGRLVGDYEESTIQSFDCGATGVEWRFVLERA